MLPKRKATQAFDCLIEEPSPGAGLRRLQRFSGFLQSNAPVPDFRVLLNGVEQRVSRYDLGDPTAPRDRRHTAYWVFHLEIPSSWGIGELALEILAETGCLARRRFRRGAPDDRGDRPLVLMLHIPKTAGTSLRLALENRPEVRLLRLYNDRAFLPPAHCAALTAAAFDDIDVVFGHFHHGLHRATRRRCRYATLLRHPADAFRSNYLFNKYVICTEAFVRLASIEDAATAPDENVDNVMTRYVAGKSTPGRVDEADLAIAIANMERDFAYVGIVEDMTTSLRVLGDVLGAPLAHHAINATPPNPESDSISRDDLLDRFGPLLRHDMALYERARELFAAGARDRDVACSG